MNWRIAVTSAPYNAYLTQDDYFINWCINIVYCTEFLKYTAFVLTTASVYSPQELFLCNLWVQQEALLITCTYIIHVSKFPLQQHWWKMRKKNRIWSVQDTARYLQSFTCDHLVTNHYNSYGSIYYWWPGCPKYRNFTLERRLFLLSLRVRSPSWSVCRCDEGVIPVGHIANCVPLKFQGSISPKNICLSLPTDMRMGSFGWNRTSLTEPRCPGNL